MDFTHPLPHIPMSKLKTVAVGGALLAALGLSTGALLMAYVNRPVKASAVVFKPESLDSVAGIKPDASKGDRVVKLSSSSQGGNASFGWSCGKTGLSGARAEEHHGHWDNLSGAVAYNAKTRTFLAVDVKFATDSFQSDTDVLTRTVVDGQRWFDVEKFPEARFTCTEAAPLTPTQAKEAASGKNKRAEDCTHMLHGKFNLNGIEQPLSMPAKISFTGESVKIEARFTVSRAAFKVESRNLSLTSGGGAMYSVDDEVNLTASVVASPDIAVMVRELNAQIQAEHAEIQLLKENNRKELADLKKSLIALKSSLEELQNAAPAQAGPPAAPVDLASLPKEFTDELVLPPVEKDYEQMNQETRLMEKKHRSYAGMKSPFKMILVPGDPGKGIAPYYIGETEVSWDLFRDWSHWLDTTPIDAQVELDKELRPSNADSYGDTSHNNKTYTGYPALGMSRLNAEKFCRLLSQKTGRKYRLPTEAEWELACQLGGGEPKDQAGKLAVAWCLENSNDTDNDDIERGDKMFAIRVGKIKTKKPNGLGLYDMLGNVAEWVKTPGITDVNGKNTFVRGGDFLTPAAQLSGTLREESNNERDRLDHESWNWSYPQNPNSIWWYKDHYQVGFRLVCEPVNLPKP